MTTTAVASSCSSSLKRLLVPRDACCNRTLVGFGFYLDVSRGYVRNFWAEKTAMMAPGHMNKQNNLFKYNKNLRIRIQQKRPSFIRLNRTRSFEAMFSHSSGRQAMMEKLIAGEKKIAEFD